MDAVDRKACSPARRSISRDKTEAEITALGEKLRGAIVLASPPQTVFQLTDRLQPADTDQPVRIGGPEPPTERQATSVVPANAMSPLLQKLGAGAILRPGAELHGTVTVGGSPQTPDGAVPTVIVMAEHYNMIVRMMQAGVVAAAAARAPHVLPGQAISTATT